MFVSLCCPQFRWIQMRRWRLAGSNDRSEIARAEWWYPECADPFLDYTTWVWFASVYYLGVVSQKVQTKNTDWKMHASSTFTHTVVKVRSNVLAPASLVTAEFTALFSVLWWASIEPLGDKPSRRLPLTPAAEELCVSMLLTSSTKQIQTCLHTLCYVLLVFAGWFKKTFCWEARVFCV